ncbi:williams-Beuren syndrome critical region protein 22 [Mycena olivaceomarginata]|nr:williams-Beuren syndrome critical region protein 22 [Mycena olivaceomarginata]
MSRPELIAPPEIYYGDIEATKYTKNTRNQQIQADMTYRALELLNLPPDQPAFLLDIGCGSGLSGEILDEEGYIWAGVDIAPSMLEVALEREVEGDLFLQDIGQGFGFRPGSFDGAISISVLQWLLNAETSHPTSSPPHRLARFFTTLHSSLAQSLPRGLPKAGFGGGIVVDYPNSKKAKKVFLCLYVGGGGGAQQLPEGLDGEEVEEGGNARFERRREREKSKNGKRKSVKAKDWILKKKELYRKRGKDGVPNDSKFTGRKRRPVF